MNDIVRVFPRRTRDTPDDPGAFVGPPPSNFHGADKVLISVTFTWDVEEARRLENLWKKVCKDVSVGGPALGDRGGDFVPGMFLKKGNVITSRGCNNRCWFCYVWKREGPSRELPITAGHVLLDNNILACSEPHVRKVFAMLEGTGARCELKGGLEAKLLKPWHLPLIRRARVRQMYLAYDEPSDLEPMQDALSLLRRFGFAQGNCCVYVLCGYPKDTLGDAEARMMEVVRCGGFPYAMLYERNPDESWRRFQRTWVRPQIVRSRMKSLGLMKTVPAERKVRVRLV